MPEIPQRVAALKKSHLFRGLDENQLSWVAGQFEEVQCAEQQVIFNQGDPGDGFFFVFKGQVDARHKVNKIEKPDGAFVQGDFFGESALILRRKRATTAVARPGTMLLRLDTISFKRIIQKIPGLNQRFEIVIRGRDMASRMKLPWLSENEMVYLLSRRHGIILIEKLILPVFLMSLTLILLGTAYLNSVAGLSAFWLTAGLGIIAVLGFWALWRYIDWSNDYYIITNRRVVWLEKVIGFYDSRQEAMLGNLLSVNTQTGLVGRTFGFGDVIVRTFTGEIVLESINDPLHAAAMVEEYWGRTKNEQQEVQRGVLRDALRKKIAPPAAEGEGQAAKAAAPATAVTISKKASNATGLQPLTFEYFLRTHWEVNNIVTYRKHLFILAARSFMPLGTFALVVFLLAFWLSSGGELTIGVAALALLVFSVILLWWTYNYVNWANDLYIITPEQIVDISRRPLGAENRQTAPLENILSVNYVRRGIFGIMFNYGTVKIAVGEINLDFNNVFNPTSVQQEVVRRMNARVAKKKEADTAAERERMSEWLAAYHQVENESSGMENKFNPE
jgi:CRP-like cAMP-binding protein